MASGLDLDAIIIDTSPSLTGFDGTLWMAIDWFLFVTECERLSAERVSQCHWTDEALWCAARKYLGRRGRVLRILPNKLKANTLLQRTVISQLAEEYQSDVWSPVVDRIAWAEAAYMRSLFFSINPTDKHPRTLGRWCVKTMEVLNVQPLNLTAKTLRMRIQDDLVIQASSKTEARRRRRKPVRACFLTP